MQPNFDPVRKIGPGQNSLRGQIQSKKNNTSHDFESALERDYLLLLEFDVNVARYVEQPVEIIYEHEGKTRKYTPDVLVYYRTDLTPAKNYKPTLIEIKYRQKIKDNWQELKPKFRAAIDYADSKGWKFKILTEKEIRNTYLENIKFLLPYRDTEYVDSNDTTLLMESIKNLDMSTPQEIIVASARDRNKQAELLFCLWHLIAIGFIGCELSSPLTMQSEIWAR